MLFAPETQRRIHKHFFSHYFCFVFFPQKYPPREAATNNTPNKGGNFHRGKVKEAETFQYPREQPIVATFEVHNTPEILQLMSDLQQHQTEDPVLRPINRKYTIQWSCSRLEDSTGLGTKYFNK
jgi:hypothetical protein